MDISIFLAKVLGWYFFIMALIIFIRPQVLKTAVAEILTQRSLLFFMGLITLIVGILLVVSHNIWVSAWPVVITIFGWLILIGGISRLAFPEFSIRGGQWWLTKPYAFIRLP